MWGVLLFLGRHRRLSEIEDAGRSIGRSGEGGMEARRSSSTAHGRFGGGPDQEAALLLHGVGQTIRVELEVDPDQDLLPLGTVGSAGKRSGDGTSGAQDDAHRLGIRPDQDGKDGLEGEGRRSLVQTTGAGIILEGHLPDLDPLLGLDEFPIGRLLDAEGRLDIDQGQIGDGSGQVFDGGCLGVVVSIVHVLVKGCCCHSLVGVTRFASVRSLLLPLLSGMLLLLGHEGLLEAQNLGEGANPRAVAPLQGDAEGLEDIPGHDVGGLGDSLAMVGEEGPAEEVGWLLHFRSIAAAVFAVHGGGRGGVFGGKDEPTGRSRHGPLGPLVVAIDGQRRAAESEGGGIAVHSGACC